MSRVYLLESISRVKFVNRVYQGVLWWFAQCMVKKQIMEGVPERQMRGKRDLDGLCKGNLGYQREDREGSVTCQRMWSGESKWIWQFWGKSAHLGEAISRYGRGKHKNGPNSHLDAMHKYIDNELRGEWFVNCKWYICNLTRQCYLFLIGGKSLVILLLQNVWHKKKYTKLIIVTNWMEKVVKVLD